ncbi:hypothetical protein ACHAXA_011375 [Cyclostephanos tholiformis]|uniref:SET domain-containing protein n=1 Tax=Cyclostephanos tholiformis TaxID=382380 RepID=A0ABD3R2M1_9STRA
MVEKKKKSSKVATKKKNANKSRPVKSSTKEDEDDDGFWDEANDAEIGGTMRVVRGALVVFVIVVALITFAASYRGRDRDRVAITARSRRGDYDDDNARSRTSRDAFLEWFVKFGGKYHPIDVGDGIMINVTMNEFPSYGGWGLALNVPMAGEGASAASDGVGNRPNNNECRTGGYDGDSVSGQLCASDGEKEKEKEERSSSSSSNTPDVVIIKRLDPLFTVPSSLIITVESILVEYASPNTSPMYLPNFRSSLMDILERTFPNGPGLSSRGMGLGQQDVIIAAYLMAEDCHNRHPELFLNDVGGGEGGGGSFWKEYLDVLPNDGIIPRLDTFDDEEYIALDDETLESVGRESRQLLSLIFGSDDDAYTGDDGGGSGEGGVGLRDVVRDMIRRKIGGPSSSSSSSTPMLLPPTSIVPDSCISFETFHRFVAIVSSRAMVLGGVKHLTPMAEMINYSPNKVGPALPFDLYHTLSTDGSITVRSDRDVFHPDSSSGGGGEGTTTTTTIQLFEDYGPVDNSLFLTAHGFVPHENPNNCASISGATFLRRGGAAVGRNYEDDVEFLYLALKVLRLIHPGVTKLESLDDVCVKENLEIVDDDDDIGWKPASDSIAITSIVLGDGHDQIWQRIEDEYGETFTTLRDKCISAIKSGDKDRIEVRCARFPESNRVVKEALRAAAKRYTERFGERGDVGEEDEHSQLQDAESRGRDKLALALRFRIEERKILDRIVHFEDDVNVTRENSVDDSGEYFNKKMTAFRVFLNRIVSVKDNVNVTPENSVDDQNQVDSSKSRDNLDRKLSAFKVFVESLGLPVNKIEPKLVGNGMRIGAFATEDLDVDDVYIALPANSVIDVNTAMADADKDSDFKALLRKLSNWSQDDGGYDALLLFLLHQRFVLKENSRWWPYLDLLPSIEELSAYHPLFFDEKDINLHLSGSDVRGSILRYRRHALVRYRALCADLNVNILLGDVVLDKEKVFWATAILDSRSIWWSGLRHLVPLLDLVNADDKGVAHQTRLVDWEGVKSKMAATAATRNVKRGDQVFQNYAKPNYLLFMNHGFLLEENAYDCALVDGISVQHSTAPSFCIKDLASIEDLARFLRTEYSLSMGGTEGSRVDDVVRTHLIQLFEGRIARLTEAATNIDIDAGMPRVQYMRQIVKNELLYFRQALQLVATGSG